MQTEYMIKNLSLLTICFFIWLNSYILGLDIESIALTFGGSFSGAFLLAYFRRDKSRSEMLFKIASATLSGIVCGSALIEYMQVTSKSYLIFYYFISALISLVIIGALLSFSEKNAKEIIITIGERIFNFAPKNKNQIYGSKQEIESIETKQTEIKITKEDK